MDYLAIANAPIFWALCGITVVISLAQALLFMRQAKRAAVEVNLEQGLANKAFKIGLISAIGPACGVFIVMVGLMASIGGPMAWLRLSIIGAAATELSAATMGAQAAGVEFGGNGYTLTGYGSILVCNGIKWCWMAVSQRYSYTGIREIKRQVKRRRCKVAGCFIRSMFPWYFRLLKCK